MCIYIATYTVITMASCLYSVAIHMHGAIMFSCGCVVIDNVFSSSTNYCVIGCLYNVGWYSDKDKPFYC